MKIAVFSDYVLNPPKEVLPLQNTKPLSSNAWFAPVAILVYSIINTVLSSACMTIYGFADNSKNSESIYNIASQLINGVLGGMIIILFCLLFYNMAMKKHYLKKCLIFIAVVPYAVDTMTGSFLAPALYAASTIGISDTSTYLIFSILASIISLINGVVSIVLSYFIVQKMLKAYEI